MGLAWGLLVLVVIFQPFKKKKTTIIARIARLPDCWIAGLPDCDSPRLHDCAIHREAEKLALD